MKFSYWPFFALIFPTLASADQYLCVPDAMTGFAYNKTKKSWVTTQFRIDHKYIISPAKDGEDAFSLTKVGEQYPEGFCKEGFDNHGYLNCITFGGQFKFNKTNGRFLAVFTLSYYNVGISELSDTDDDSGTPSIEIGKCSPF